SFRSDNSWVTNERYNPRAGVTGPPTWARVYLLSEDLSLAIAATGGSLVPEAKRLGSNFALYLRDPSTSPVSNILLNKPEEERPNTGQAMLPGLSFGAATPGFSHIAFNT